MTNRTIVYLKPPDLDSIQAWRGNYPPPYAHWSAFVAHCRSLARDGLQYRVTVKPYAARPHILIEASGIIGRRKVSKPANGLPALLTPEQAQRGLTEALKDQAVWARHLASKWGWWRTREGYNYGYAAGVEERKRSRKFGHWLADRLARRRGCRGARGGYLQTADHFTPNLGDYKSADQTFGRHIPRVSQLSKSEREGRGWVRAIAGRLGIHWGWRETKREPDLGVPYALRDDETPRLARADWVERFLARQKPASYLDVSELTEYRRARVEVEYWREILRLLGERKCNGRR